MTMQEVYASYVKKAGMGFLNAAGNNARVEEIKANFERFCEVVRTKTKTKAIEPIEM